MAHLREYDTTCQGIYVTCGKRAVVELLDRWNGNKGKYCRKHGEQALTLQTLRENPEPSKP